MTSSAPQQRTLPDSEKASPHVRTSNADFTSASVLVIGSGLSGMNIGIDLLKRGIKNFIIVEKGSGIGGTWRDNKYPGCCCDVVSLLYSYSFEQKADWSRLYPGQEEILDYLTGVASKYNLYKHIRFNTSVESAAWNDTLQCWDTKISVSGDKETEYQKSYTIRSDFLISAVGQLNLPNLPDNIPHRDSFKGRIMHSARWDWSYNLEGKRIAVIGNGASAVQIIPEMTKVASHLTVFQRSPAWVIPRMDGPVAGWKKWLLEWVPPVRWKVRSSFMALRESVFNAVTDAQGPVATMVKESTTARIEAAFPGPANAEIRRNLTPTYAPLCKRVLVSDDYYPALAKPNTSVEFGKLLAFTENGLLVDSPSGPVEHPFDLIVCATGFKALQFMSPIEFTGRHGRKLTDIWASGARALYGVTVEDMPNFGMLYGPNTNLGHNSIILMIEQQASYINALVEALQQHQARTRSKAVIVPRTQRLDEFNAELQAELATSSFADTNCSSWYKDPATGLITTNWSRTVIDYQKLLSAVDWADYEGGQAVAGAARASKKHVGRVREEPYLSDSALFGLTTAAALLGVGALAHGYVRRLL